MGAQPKLGRLRRLFYRIDRGRDGHCSSCVHLSRFQFCRRYAPAGVKGFQDIGGDSRCVVNAGDEWCGEHRLDPELIAWDPIWRRRWRSLRLRYQGWQYSRSTR